MLISSCINPVVTTCFNCNSTYVIYLASCCFLQNIEETLQNTLTGISHRLENLGNTVILAFSMSALQKIFTKV